MFNFLKDSIAFGDGLGGFDQNESMPRWTVLFDSKTWFLIVP